MRDIQGSRPDRHGQRILAAYVDPATHRAFKMLAAEEGTTNVALMHEAVTLVLARHGKPLPQPAIDHLKEHHRPLPVLVPPRKSNGHRPG
jgi:hypothetical protein